MWFVIFQGISQPLNGKGLHETFAVENFLVVMALCTVLTCLPVMPVNSARRGECWLHFLELTPLIFLSLIVSLCTPGPPVISQTCLVTSAIACSQGGRGEMLHRWEWRRAVVRHFCISFTRRKKKKARDRQDCAVLLASAELPQRNENRLGPAIFWCQHNEK